MIIIKDSLPVSESARKELWGFSAEKQQESRLIVLKGIYQNLRSDYRDESLPMPDRAIRHIKVKPEAWRVALEVNSLQVIRAAIGRGQNPERIAVLYPWRGGLAFAKASVKCKIRHHFHIGLKRDESEPHKTAEIYLPLTSKDIVKDFDRVIIADPMLATGGSFVTIIKILLAMGFMEGQITLASIVSAPEGIFNLFNEFPGIKIVTAALDSHLNELGYIQPGLGDAGDKFFSGLTIEYFIPIRWIFSAQEWALLKSLIKAANP